MLVIYVIIISLLVKKKWPAILALLLIITFSNPIVARFCTNYLEKEYRPIDFKSIPKFNNIVILSGMVRPILSNGEIKYEFNESVDRIIIALKLIQSYKTKNIILTKGKLPWSLGISEGEFLRKYLIENGTKSQNIILTSEAYNTEQEAEAISKIVNPDEIFGLITSSFHMPRTSRIFKEKNLNFYPIPVDFRVSYSKFTILSLIPNSQALNNTSIFFREMMGRLYYRFKLIIQKF